MSIRPKVGGFPYLAEVLRSAGVTHNQWHLPSCQSLYLTKYGPVVSQGTPLVTGICEVAKFDREALIQDKLRGELKHVHPVLYQC